MYISQQFFRNEFNKRKLPFLPPYPLHENLQSRACFSFFQQTVTLCQSLGQGAGDADMRHPPPPLQSSHWRKGANAFHTVAGWGNAECVGAERAVLSPGVRGGRGQHRRFQEAVLSYHFLATTPLSLTLCNWTVCSLY